MTTTKNETREQRIDRLNARVDRRMELAQRLLDHSAQILPFQMQADLRQAATEINIMNTEIVLTQAIEMEREARCAGAPRPPVNLFPRSMADYGFEAAQPADPKPMGEKAWAKEMGELIQREVSALADAMKRDPVDTGRTTVTVGAMNIPGRREPGITLQAGEDGRLGPEPQRVHLGPLTVTITGPQGAGKSRLAAMIRSKLFFYDDVTIVELTGEGPAVPLPPGVRFIPDAPEITDAMVERAVDGWDQYWNGYSPAKSEMEHAKREALRHVLQQALGVRS